MKGWLRFRVDGWRGWVDPAGAGDLGSYLEATAAGEGRRSRHARTLAIDGRSGRVFVKTYAPPGGGRARRALRMGRALAHAGFDAPVAVAVARRGREGLLVTRDVGGLELRDAIARSSRREKRTLLETLGREVGRLHAAGFVHGDLVPPNVHVCAGRIVLLDHDRTRHGRLLVWLGARRNLVQLGRFVVNGITLSDRARVLAAYGRVRGLGRRARHRLAWWVVGKTTARRCAIDAIAPAEARRAGFRELMRGGGPFDPAGRAA